MLLIHTNVSNFTQTLNDIFEKPKFGESCWNSQMILVHLKEVIILISGSVYFAIRGKKEWQISLKKSLPLLHCKTVGHFFRN